ncbi:uncharacterized protein A1O9_04764 [Exophiala aquamarina CBS 119918]|uniref:Pentatricopeptide repeat domain-containing protein n=1 Tax=Exophiala aquamarina CBS 119918 TaxID=1182545 RepID=A0A072PJ56_9EURO|nr:uncharacterized protein A1O9_04764 [Exophiala aquamarina CBS 119918]KEF59916.1 hypothetical protein A1O9_04764 [Exophiala aquamarina CBS 119918]
MPHCTACIRRALNYLPQYVESPHTLRLRTSQIRFPGPIGFRNHSTLISIRTGHHRRELLKSLRKTPKSTAPNLRPKGLKRTLAKEKDEAARAHNRARFLNPSKGPRVPSQYEESILTDRLKLANEVLRLLQKDQLLNALELCRASERSINGAPPVDSVVSWNHVIDWLMMRRDTAQAWKVFNEMKKRGHKPSSHTITILLRGYQENFKNPNVVKQALAVYNSIFASNSPVKPSIIHTNAILAVCARGGDMDSIWSITGRLPDRGPDTADHKTYTTLLTALSADARDWVLKLGSQEQKRAPENRSLNAEAILEQAVEDGRRMWTEVTARWRSGDLEMDAKLVCAMGRLLMLSSQRKHHQEILALVEQTMNINVVDEMLKTPQSALTTDAASDSETNPSTPAQAQTPHEDPPKNVAISGGSDPHSRDSINKAPRISANSVFAKPDNNTLSMCIETAMSLKEVEAGKKMWRICTSPTSPYHLTTDKDNISAYLRFLRVARASREALDVLQALPSDLWQGSWSKGFFVIAMSTCVRDKNNPNVFGTASRILDLMQEKAEQYDETSEEENRFPSRRMASRVSPKVLSSYVQLAMATTPGLNGEKLTKNVTTGDLNFERDASKNNVLRALRRLSPTTINIKQLIKLHVSEYERQLKDGSRTHTVQRILREQAAVPEPIQELLDYLTTLISAYDKLLMINEQLEDEGLGPLSKEILIDINMEKRKLSSFVGMINNVPGMSSKFEKIKAWPLEPVENEDQERQRRLFEKASLQSSSNDLIESSAQREIKGEIEKEEKKADRRKLLRGLSTRQRHELQKELHIREKFPTSLERPSSNTRERFVRESRVGAGHLRRRVAVGEASESVKMSEEQAQVGGLDRGDENETPASKLPAGFQVPELTRYPSRRLPPQGERRTMPASSQRTENAERGSRRRYANLPPVKGWGGGFAALAKKQGQSPSDFLDLSNR